MDIIAKTVLGNILLLFLSSSVVSWGLNGKGDWLTVLVLILLLLVALNFVIGVALLMIKPKTDLVQGFLLSSGVLLLIGLSICWGSLAIY